MDRLIAAYREAAKEFGAALFLTQKRRHANRIRVQMTGCAFPVIFDIQSFADELVHIHNPDIRPHADGDRQLLLDSALTELRERKALPYFDGVAETRGYTDAVCGYITELKDAVVEWRQLVKASPNWDGGVSANRHAQAVNIFERYHRRLAKLNRFDPQDRFGRAATLWADGKQKPLERVRSVFLGGFTTFTPLQRKLIDSLRETVEHLWLELPDGEGEAFAELLDVRNWINGSGGKRSLVDSTTEVKIEYLDPGKTKPSGVRHLVNLFGNEKVSVGASTSGLHLIEAPGELGEARLVARQIRTLLASGTPAGRILIATRNLTRTTAELYREVLNEYAIPHDIEGADALNRIPAVAFLLQAWRLPSEDWPFASVAAVLRSTYFRPKWPEVQSDPEVPARAETLLRMLGEARGRDAYLTAVGAWEHTPPEPLEDEQAEEPLRKRKQRLAELCRPFLERFFQAWDKLKINGTAETVVSRLQAFADDIGLSITASEDPADAAGLARFWSELNRWARAEPTSRKTLRPERFARILSIISSVPCRARTSRESGCVTLLSANAAVGIDCDYLFLIELGEGSWPDLSAPTSLLDDHERERLRNFGFKLANPAARLGLEQLLFLNLATAPRKGLFLSYAGIDEKGQPLLPSSFLRELKGLFPPGSIPTTRRQMLLDGYFEQEPLSPAELRVQVAHDWEIDEPAPPLEPELLDNLHRAAATNQLRFRTHDFGSFDGILRHAAVADELAKRFGPKKVLSPTALETYVACPFRFWLEHVLRLEPLEDPSEEVEKTRRGAAFHRALARFHEQHTKLNPASLTNAELPEDLTEKLIAEIERAIEEYAARAPSRATAELWRLEGIRLKCAANRYRGHWHEFRKPWREKNAIPKPFRFEADFGVPGENVDEALLISVGDIDVRIGGRIDRVDVADLEGTHGFWVIDYKTGRAANYQPGQVERFEKLQLPLYALAVERVLLNDRPARPLGLAYWLVTDSGPKGMLPSGKRNLLSWLSDAGKWERFRAQLEIWVVTLVQHIRAGDFPLSPRSEYCTDTCAFGPVCRIAQSRNTGKVFPLALPVLAKEKEAN
jgi:ATP-dependent helicase/nuclease subunit B